MAKRVYFGSSALAIRPTNVTISSGLETETVASQWSYPRGIQSVGFNTSVAFEPMFQLGQTEIYGRMETQSPEVECTISKAIDGTMPIYTQLMSNRNNELPAALQSCHSEIALGIYAEAGSQVSGAGQAAVYCSGMYVSNLTINLPLDGVATEEVTLIGDTRKWGTYSSFGLSNPTDFGSQEAQSKYQRWSVDVSTSTLPTGVKNYPIQSISVTMGIGRESIQELGTRGKYCRYATFPFEVTSEFEVIAGHHRDGANGVTGNDVALVIEDYDFVNNAAYACASASKYDDTPLTDPSSVNNGEIDLGFRDQPIKIKVCGASASDYLEIDLGEKNRPTAVNYSGGGTDGGNATISYSFQNYNFLKLNGFGTFASADALTP